MYENDSLAYTMSQASRQLATKIDEIHHSVIKIEEFLHDISEEFSNLKNKHRNLTKELTEIKEQISNSPTDYSVGTIFRFESPITIQFSDKKFEINEFIDELTLDVMDLFVKANQASVSMVQRRFRVGYSRAARIVDYLELQGMISTGDGSKSREVLISERDWETIKDGILYKSRPNSHHNSAEPQENSARYDAELGVQGTLKS